jgi:serine protease DegS
MQQIIENGKVVRGWLGISTNSYDNNLKGFILDEVTLGTPAQTAGLKTGDIVYQIGEQLITSVNHALDIIAETPPNTVLTFKIYRQGNSINKQVKILELEN